MPSWLSHTCTDYINLELHGEVRVGTPAVTNAWNVSSSIGYGCGVKVRCRSYLRRHRHVTLHRSLDVASHRSVKWRYTVPQVGS